jgi:hypothetical protein
MSLMWRISAQATVTNLTIAPDGQMSPNLPTAFSENIPARPY